MRAAITGISGPGLLADEAALLRACPPAGVILFSRNVADPAQLSSLITDLRAVLPDGAVIMMDQEGGRVARLRPPYWAAHPPAGAIGALYDLDPAAGLRAAWLQGALIGLDCAGVGISVACAPVLDLRVPGASDVVGDRSFSADSAAVAALGRAMADGMLAAGVQPVAKHAPGHGRARVDSHHEMPVVAAAMDDDLAPFASLSHLPWMMTAHVLYPGWDPEHPATLSPGIIARVIRGRIGFGGLLVSDDLAMGALCGTPGPLAREALAAGCDIALHCTGRLDDMEDLLRACPELTAAGRRRLVAARALADGRRVTLDGMALADERGRLLA